MTKRKPSEFEKYLENEDFFHFISQEFNDVAREATLEELAEFAFGSEQEAVEAFKEKSELSSKAAKPYRNPS